MSPGLVGGGSRALSAVGSFPQTDSESKETRLETSHIHELQWTLLCPGPFSITTSRSELRVKCLFPAPSWSLQMYSELMDRACLAPDKSCQIPK